MTDEQYQIARAAYENSPCAVEPFDDLPDNEKREWLRVAHAVVAVIAKRLLNTGEHWRDAVNSRLERFR